MVKIGRLDLNESPKVAVSLKDGVPSRAIAAMHRAGVDLIELRIDLFCSRTPRRVLSEISRYKKFPVLATVRSRREGGRWRGSDAERIALYEALLPHVDAVDVELSSAKVLAAVAPAARKAKKTLIISFHDFARTPSLPALRRILGSAQRAGADIVKIAAHAMTFADMRALGAFTASHRQNNLITIAMGKEGALSRVLFPAMGSLVTFSCYGKPTAPGQFPYHSTLSMLKRLGQR